MKMKHFEVYRFWLELWHMADKEKNLTKYIEHRIQTIPKQSDKREKKMKWKPSVIFPHFNPISSITENSRINIRKRNSSKLQYLHTLDWMLLCCVSKFQNVFTVEVQREKNHKTLYIALYKGVLYWATTAPTTNH